ncbi:tRNA lysidine(34) synthetase TilS [Buchnera aphidicola]|uniref:tRNA lysidine(34) synthetase TilS n=1 Tax=Buchnera aphidicola TaxID=9 RepID=UPI0031B85EDB
MTILNKINKIIKEKQHFLLSYSGGLDSTVLLHLMIKLREIKNIHLRAIHINHRLHKESTLWSNHCQEKCKKYNIPIIINNITIHQTKNNMESYYRNIRYQLIYKNILPQETLLTAHHLNDQCETFLLALKRGSGPTGLSCMPVYKKNGNITHMRPLLNISQDTIKKWAKKHQLKWIEDPSNSNIKYDRNFIRKKIIPILQKRWPFFIKNCSRSAKICNEQEQVIDLFLEPIVQKNTLFDNSLNITYLKKINKELRNIILRKWIIKNGVQQTPSYNGINRIYTDIINNNKTSTPKISFKKYEIKKYKNTIHLIQPIMPSMKHIILFWHDTSLPLSLPNQLGQIINNNTGMKIPYPKKSTLINIRFQANGTFYIDGYTYKIKLKNIWKMFNLPYWKRENIPLLFYDNILISALGVFVTRHSNLNFNKYWYLSWQNNITKNKNYI